jgi:hypothetical protein
VPVDKATTEGKLFERLGTELYNRHDRLERLDRYYRGDPPLPESLSNLRDVAHDFFRTSRTNFAELVAEAPRERMKPTGIRTAATDGSDEDGDEAAWAQWINAGLPILSADVHQSMLALGDGYVIVSWDELRRRPVVTAEDPRQVVTLHDPMTDQIFAALKVYRDHAERLDVAYMYTPGAVLVATKPASEVTASFASFRFNAADWEWDPDRSQPLPTGYGDVIPVVRFRNRDCVSEFERHIDVLDRINRTILRGMVIMTYQAFKQRAIKGDLPERDDAGSLINYDEVLKAGPDALWLLPPEVDIWESGQVDLTPLLAFVKNDVLKLAAVTRTPLAMLTPDAATQSAEGASLQREGLVFKTEDRIARASRSWSTVVSLMFRFAGDAARSDVASIEIMWAPVERYSLSERANAIAQTKGVVSRYQQLTEIWGMSPAQANRALSELADDLVLDQQYAAGLKAATAAQQPATQQPALGQ